MSIRISRVALALGLLGLAWPAFAHLLGGALVAVTGLSATHPTVTLATAAGVLLLGALPGPVDRVLTRLTAGQPRGRT